MPIVPNVRAEPHCRPAVPEPIWDSNREGFTLPAPAEMETHFRSLGESEGMRRAIRVFIGEETFCPGFKLKDGVFHKPVLRLFDHAMALKVPLPAGRAPGPWTCCTA